MSELDAGFDEILENGRFKKNFKDESEPIGIGSFGVVTKARQTIDDKEYAIKKVIIRNKEDYEHKVKEVKIWAKFSSDLFVQYRSAWVEHPDQEYRDRFVLKMVEQMWDFDIHSEEFTNFKEVKQINDFYLFYMQMDLCLFSLRDALNNIKQYFKIEKKEFFPPVPYYMASELLIEILESIEYMHGLNPPILHRDIKPDNILIKIGPKAKFIKLADFGLSVLHNYPDISHTQFRGTLKYMAPEVMTSRKYDAKADMYSIGVMIQELFNFDINVQQDSNMSDRYNRLVHYTGMAMNGLRKARPTSSEFLKAKSEWGIEFKDVKDDIIKIIELNKDYDIKTEFTQYFLKAKFEFNRIK